MFGLWHYFPALICRDLARAVNGLRFIVCPFVNHRASCGKDGVYRSESSANSVASLQTAHDLSRSGKNVLLLWQRSSASGRPRCSYWRSPQRRSRWALISRSFLRIATSRMGPCAPWRNVTPLRNATASTCLLLHSDSQTEIVRHARRGGGDGNLVCPGRSSRILGWT